MYSLRHKGKKRGTIIVDAVALFSLGAPTGKTHGTEQSIPYRYTAILNFLATHGFDIIIPEMIAFETTRFLANGDNLNQWQGRSASAAQEQLLEFVKSVIHGDYDNISVPACIGPPNVKEFLDQAYEIIRSTVKGSTEAHDRGRALKSSDHRQFGDQEIVYLAKHLKAQGQLYILTSDGGLYDDIAKDVPAACLCSADALVEGIVQNNLHNYIPALRTDITAQQMNSERYEHTRKLMGEINKPASLDCRASEYISFQQQKSQIAASNHPFSDSCKQLAQELAGQRAVPASWKDPGAGSSTTPYAGRH